MKKTLTLLTTAALLLPVIASAQTAATTQPTTATPPATTTKAPATTKAALPAGTIIHINSASAEDLAKLPGVDAKIAAEIIKSRPFKSSKDLVKKVKGIGKHNVKAILPYIDFK